MRVNKGHFGPWLSLKEIKGRIALIVFENMKDWMQKHIIH